MRLEDIIREKLVSVRFQPIVALRDGVVETVAVEALSRGPENSSCSRADVLFEYARQKRMEPELDTICASAAMQAFGRAGLDCSLSLNMHASTLGQLRSASDTIKLLADDHGVRLDNLIIEILEHTPYWDKARFFENLAALRRAGVRIALDDIGCGYSNGRFIVDVQPDFMKIDRYLVTNVARDERRAALIQAFGAFAQVAGATLIGEGMEDKADSHALMQLGVTHQQGFFWCPPAALEEVTVWMSFHARPRPRARVAYRPQFDSPALLGRM